MDLARFYYSYSADAIGFYKYGNETLFRLLATNN